MRSTERNYCQMPGSAGTVLAFECASRLCDATFAKCDQPEATTMKTISRRIWGVLLVLYVLGSIGPVIRADEIADWMAEQRRQNDEYHRQWQQWREEAQKAQDAQDKYYAERDARDKADREWQQTLNERAAYYKWFEEKQREREWYDEMYRLGGWSAATSDSRPAGLVILNPFALAKMAPADQQKVRQQAALSGQPIMPESQLIQNPFVVAP